MYAEDTLLTHAARRPRPHPHEAIFWVPADEDDVYLCRSVKAADKDSGTHQVRTIERQSGNAEFNDRREGKYPRQRWTRWLRADAEVADSPDRVSPTAQRRSTSAFRVASRGPGAWHACAAISLSHSTTTGTTDRQSTEASAGVLRSDGKREKRRFWS